MSELELTLAFQIKVSKLPEPIREHRFNNARQWRFDFAWPLLKIAAECEGGTWSGGRHTRGSGFAKDAEKYNMAALDGWKVLRFTSVEIEDGRAVALIEKALREAA